MNEDTLLEALHNFKRIYSGDKVSIKLIDNLIGELFALKVRLGLTSDIIPPPDWQSVHIGEGVSVPGKNPELECEVAR